MQRKLISLLAAVTVFSVAALGSTHPSPAALCGQCRDMLFIESEGKCIGCGGPTGSGPWSSAPSAVRSGTSANIAWPQPRQRMKSIPSSGRPRRT